LSADRKFEMLFGSTEKIQVAGNYVPCVRSGNLVFVSGMLPRKGGNLTHTGKLGVELGKEAGYNAAKNAVLYALMALKSELGSLDMIQRVVQLVVYVNCSENFTDIAYVANGASDTLVEVFGDCGVHTRISVGVASLPMNSPVELCLTVETR